MENPRPNTPNLSLYAIPTAYTFAYVPHAHYLVRMMIASGGKWTNVAPRGNFEALKGKVPQEVWSRCFRARGAHINALEGFPLFAAAMIAGNMVQLPAQELNSLAVQYLGVRALYSVVYIGVRSEALSYLRTGLWAWSIGIPIWALVKAGQSLNDAGLT